jgi:probable rRNA maturation factor
MSAQAESHVGPAGAADAGSPAVELSIEAGGWPDGEALETLVARAVAAAVRAAGRSLAGHEVSVLLTDDAGIRPLNARWRGQDKATNVLSFPQTSGLLIGDVVLAYETVAREAAVANRPLNYHIAHLVVHGCLHLLGYEHEDDAEAERMEDLERAALSMIGIPDPYACRPTEQ